MVEGGMVMLAKAGAARPALAIPPRSANESFVRSGSDNVTPSPLTFVSSLFAENEPFTESKSFLGLLDSSSFLPAGGEPPILSYNSNNKGSLSDMQASNKQDDKGSVVELQANYKQDGFNGIGVIHSPHYSARYRSMMPSRLPIPSDTAFFTIPPGLSPTTLLDSPVLFNAGPVDPSPTTGSLLGAGKLHSSLLPAGADLKKEREDLKQQNVFMFKPHLLTTTCQEIPIDGTSCFGVSYQTALQRGDGSAPVPTPVVDATLSTFESTLGQTSSFLCSKLEPQEPTDSATTFTKPLDIVSTSQASEFALHNVSERTAADGYNWKKYGQKQLKGTEFPRSYYKCTHPNCFVKKQVECSLEGEVTEILYKGEHNHARPQGTRRGVRNNASSLERSERGTNVSGLENAGEVSSVTNRADLDRFSTELSSTSLALSHGCLAATSESFGSPSFEEGEDGEGSKFEDDCENEQDSKRRRMETLVNAPIRTIREPRVVVQTTSGVDVLDDGYRWRKYGQKVVKGNRFPRSYYKCTNTGCIVRKHVERSSTDPTSVITAYEGKHNHNVPAARGSSAREGVGTIAGPLPVPTYTSIRQPSAEMGAGSSMLHERQELSSYGENRCDGGAGIAATSFADIDINGALAASMSATQGMGLTFSGARQVDGVEQNVPLGLSLLQPVYAPSMAPYAPYVAEGHAPRS